jgi:hypothetical protein
VHLILLKTAKKAEELVSMRTQLILNQEAGRLTMVKSDCEAQTNCYIISKFYGAGKTNILNSK